MPRRRSDLHLPFPGRRRATLLFLRPTKAALRARQAAQWPILDTVMQAVHVACSAAEEASSLAPAHHHRRVSRLGCGGINVQRRIAPSRSADQWQFPDPEVR